MPIRTRIHNHSPPSERAFCRTAALKNLAIHKVLSAFFRLARQQNPSPIRHPLIMNTGSKPASGNVRQPIVPPPWLSTPGREVCPTARLTHPRSGLPERGRVSLTHRVVGAHRAIWRYLNYPQKRQIDTELQGEIRRAVRRDDSSGRKVQREINAKERPWSGYAFKRRFRFRGVLIYVYELLSGIDLTRGLG